MSRVIFVTQRIDPEDPNLGAVVPMVRALAERSDEVVVLALSAVAGALPANCTVRTFGAGSQAARGARFASALAGALRPRPTLLIAHMSPIYAILAAPLCLPARVPIVLWFTHWRASTTLKLAERVSSAVATVDRSSFPVTSRKVAPIGHGIDVAEFPCRPAPDDATLHALALGRTSPAKGLEAVIEGVRLARSRGVDVELEIRGGAQTPEEQAHRRRLLELAGDGVSVEEPVPRAELRQVFARAGIAVNAAAAGSLDKSVYEACASCVPVLASNRGFAELLPPELRFERGNVDEIAGRLAAFAARPVSDRAALGRELRERVAREHSVEHWADAILALADR